MQEAETVFRGVERAVELPLLSVDQDLPRVGALEAGEDLYQRRFAGSVGPHKRLDVPGRNGQRQVGKGLRAAIALTDPSRFQQWPCGGCGVPRNRRHFRLRRVTLHCGFHASETSLGGLLQDAGVVLQKRLDVLLIDQLGR